MTDSGHDEPGHDEPGRDARDSAIARFAATRHEGGDWSATAPQEVGGLGQVAGFWRDLDGLAEAPAVVAMREQALARLNASTAPTLMARQRRWRTPAVAALAASLVAVVGLGIAHRSDPPAFQAAVPAGQVIANGQHVPRDVTLADGTQVTLDSQTQLHVAAGGRNVRLDYGRAFFRVRHDAANPFAVQVAGMTIHDIGTMFEVRQEQGATSVTLVEGKVRVARSRPGSGAISGQAVDLAPGARLTLRGDRWSVENLDATRQTLWQSGMISADDVPVSDVVAQFNRYLARPLVIKDPAAQSVRISGEFRLDDPEGFVAALSAMGHGAMVTGGAPDQKPAGHSSA